MEAVRPTPRYLTVPMALTFLRIALVPVFVILLITGEEWRWHAITVAAFMGLTDFLDGYLARRLKQTTRLGEILDPVADKLLVLCALILLATPSVGGQYAIPILALATVLFRDVVAVVGSLLLLSRVPGARIPARLSGKLATALQIALILCTMLAPAMKQWGFEPMPLLVALWWITAASSIAAGIVYYRVGMRIYHAHRDAQHSADRGSPNPRDPIS